jgi:hypothetical protein
MTAIMSGENEWRLDEFEFISLLGVADGCA